MVALLAAGFAVLLAGLLAIGFGIPVKEFSFGNTLIAAGALGACTGTVLVALAFVLRELKAISRAVNTCSDRLLNEGRNSFTAPHRTGGANDDREFDTSENSGPTESPQRHEHLVHDAERVSEAAGAPPSQTMVTKRRKNLLFMSTRRDRLDTSLGDSPADVNASSHDALGTGGEPGLFEGSWQTFGVPRSEISQRQDMQPDDSRAPTRAASRPVRRPSEAPAVTILKSGVVDGMAYSLYSDGSIEAQLPEGMVRFSSLEELRNYLDHRG